MDDSTFVPDFGGTILTDSIQPSRRIRADLRRLSEGFRWGIIIILHPVYKCRGFFTSLFTLSKHPCVHFHQKQNKTEFKKNGSILVINFRTSVAAICLNLLPWEKQEHICYEHMPLRAYYYSCEELIIPCVKTLFWHLLRSYYFIC